MNGEGGKKVSVGTRRKSSPVSRDSDREKLLASKEIQLREHELELLQFESKMDELYKQMANWRDACAETLQKASKENINIPEIPSALLKFDKTRKKQKKKKRTSDPLTETSSNESSDEDDEVMILIEESSKNRKEKAKSNLKGKLKAFSCDMIPQVDQHSPKSNFIVPSLIEPLTKPPEKTTAEVAAQMSTPKLINKNLIQVNKTPKKRHSLTPQDTDLTPQIPENKKNSSNTSKSDNEDSIDMRDYLSTSLGVSRGSLFDDNDIDQSDMEVLNKIMAQNSVPNRLSESTAAPTCNSTGNIHSGPVELPRTRSTQNFQTRAEKPRSASEEKRSPEQNYPADIINISKKIRGLEELLQPFRSLKFKFGAFVDLPRAQQQTNTILNTFRFSKRLTRNTPTLEAKEVTYISTKCLIILFDDVICICSEKQLEVRLPIVETWMETDLLMGAEDGMFPFTINTPEKTFKCYLDQESKLNALRKIWQVTLRARLEQENKYVGDFRRVLAYEFKSGQLYEGEWKAAKFNGKGKQRFVSGEYYEGYFTNGKRNGFGTWILPNKQRYDGYWKFGQRHGKGTLYYSSLDQNATKFVGLWKEDQQHGDGQLHLKNGNILKTTWKFGLPTYPAVLCLEDKRTRYVGDLSERFHREGFGVCIYASDDRYYGQWVNEERQGKGFYVTSKGTEYHGAWANNQMEGSGTLCFGNDESIITGKFSGDMSTGVVKVDGEFKLSRYDSQTRLSTLQGYKWHCFFSMRLTQYEKSEEAQVLNDILLASIAKGEQLQGEIQQDLFNIFQCRKHPLGKLVTEFISIFKAMYHRPEQHFMQLECAVDDLRSFLNLLSENFVSQFLKCQVPHEECSHALHDVLFPEVGETLLVMYNITHEEKDKQSDEKLKKIIELPLSQQMAVCGIDEKYWIQIQEFIESDIRLKAVDIAPSAEKAPYQNAVNAMRSMAVQQTVTKKLECIRIAATRVEGLLKKIMGQFGADEFLPMFCLVMVQSEAPKLHSECCFMEDFMDDNLRFNVYGYLLAQMQIATGFIISCDIRSKLEDYLPESPVLQITNRLSETLGPL